MKPLSFTKALSILLILAAACLAQAETVCKTVYGPSAISLRRSIEMRQKIQTFYESRLRKTTDLRESLIAKLMSEISKTWQQKEDLKKTAPQSVGGIPLDFSQIPNVLISKETLSALQSAFGPDVWRLGPRQHQELIAHAEKSARKDAYLQWLNRNYTLSVPAPERPEIDSVRILFNAFLLPPYPLGLPPRLAFLRLYEILDPNVTDTQRKIMTDLVQLQRVKNTLEEDLENLHSTNGSAGAWDAAGLAPSLDEARLNLQDILSRQERQFGARFPRVSFERAHILIRKNDPAIRFLFDSPNGADSTVPSMKDSTPAPAVSTQAMESLKSKLGLPEAFPTTELESTLRILFRSGTQLIDAKYQAFLVEAFMSEGSAKTVLQIRNLETLIDYMQSMEDWNYYYLSLHERVHRLYQSSGSFRFPPI